MTEKQKKLCPICGRLLKSRELKIDNRNDVISELYCPNGCYKERYVPTSS